MAPHRPFICTHGQLGDLARPTHRPERLHFPRQRPVASLIATILLMSCGASVDLVPRGPRGQGGPPIVQVSTFPPPATIEVIPLRRHPDCFWQDGRWEPGDPRGQGGSTWVWKPGSWVRPPADCYYAPPETAVENSGSGTHLLYVPGAYYVPDSGQPCPAPPPCE
jgi:hypothetical protein